MTQPFTAKEALKFGFETFSKNMGYCLVFAFAMDGLALLAAITLALNTTRLAQFITQLDAPPPDTFLYALIGWFVIVRMMLGVVSNKFYLLLADDKRVTVDDILGFDVQYHIPVIFRHFAATIVYSVCSFIGSLFLFVPGLFIASSLRLFKFALVDEESDAIESLKQSYDLGGTHRIDLVGLTVQLWVLKLIGFLALGIGLVPAGAICSLAEARAYKCLSHEVELESASS